MATQPASLEIIEDFLDHPHVDGVADVRAVQANGGDRVGDRVVDGLQRGAFTERLYPRRAVGELLQ